MERGLRAVTRAADLDEAWDLRAEIPFQRRAFLAHLERVNPCDQCYWEWHGTQGLRAGLVTYRLRRNLLTFRGIPSPIRITFLGLPVSVAAPGIIGDPEAARALLQAALPHLPGLVVGLNLTGDPDLPGAAFGDTLPSVGLEVRWRTFRDYRDALRSEYRRRLARIEAAWEGVETVRRPCQTYDNRLHDLYLAVWRRSPAPLERLSEDFFRGLPECCHLTVHREGNRVLAWHACWTEGDRRWFLFGGLDDEARRTRLGYFNLLAGLLREAIEDGVRWLDLGQTAEVPKMRLGGTLRPLRMFGWHRWAAVRGLIRLAAPMLAWRRSLPPTRPFRREETLR